MSFSEYMERLYESNSDLLDRLAAEFGKEIVFSRAPYIADGNSIGRIAGVLDACLFEGKINSNTPEIFYGSYNQICKLLKSRYEAYCPEEAKFIAMPKNTFFGIHDVFVENNIKELKPEDKLVFSHELIVLNAEKLKARSFILTVASLCHELIHCYDLLFGEYESLRRFGLMKRRNVSDETHWTSTFKAKQKLAISKT